MRSFATQCVCEFASPSEAAEEWIRNSTHSGLFITSCCGSTPRYFQSHIVIWGKTADKVPNITRLECATVLHSVLLPPARYKRGKLFVGQRKSRLLHRLFMPDLPPTCEGFSRTGNRPDWVTINIPGSKERRIYEFASRQVLPALGSQHHQKEIPSYNSILFSVSGSVFASERFSRRLRWTA